MFWNKLRPVITLDVNFIIDFSLEIRDNVWYFEFVT